MPGFEKIIKIVGQDSWDKLVEQDPSLSFYAAANWQDSYDIVKAYIAPDPTSEVLSVVSPEKGKSPFWRELQKQCWHQYRTFGPITATVNSKSEIRHFLKDLYYSYRNRLYWTIPGWITRMLGEGELFLLLVFDEEGKATVRALEPGRIGKGNEDGLLTDPDDVTQTLFYEHYSIVGNREVKELIPDIRIAFDPELVKKAKDIRGYKLKDTKPSKGGRKYKNVGSFRRFVIHWKNLTGIQEYKRDNSVLASILEAKQLYWNAIKWQLDHKRAQSAYTNIISFADTPAGRFAFTLH
jgi:hypothetical protein